MKLKTKRKVSSPAQPLSPLNYSAINAVLGEHLELAWTEGNQAAIKRMAGPENFLRVREILSFASNQDAWLNDSSLSAAADKVGGKLSQQYPGLSPAAIFRIVSQATYGWR